MKFIHTADWQVGMPFKSLVEKADILRRARIDAIKQLVALAEKEQVDFILAAGDLFDDNRIAPTAVEETVAALRRSPVPVFMLPGNHDPLTPDSPYVRCPQLFSAPIVVLRAAEPVTVDGGTIFPCPAFTKASSKDPTSWIPPRDGAHEIRIGVAHGSCGTPEQSDFPIPRNASRDLDLDYLALGHWHSVKKINDRTWYSGAPEATAFAQPDAGKVLIVEIDSAQAIPKVKPVPVSRIAWTDLEFEVHSEQDVDGVIESLDKLNDPYTLVRLRVSGVISQCQISRLERLRNERVLHVKLEFDVVPNDGNWKYTHPLLKEMANVLISKASASDDNAPNATRALSQLALLTKHAGFRNEEVK